MTSTAPDPTVGNLQPFDGTPVLRSTIQITKAGDGLSEALKVEPREFHMDDEVFVVIRTKVSRVLFKPLEKDSDYLVRVHTLAADTATIVSAELVGDVIKAQAEAILLAKEQEQGVKRLPFDGDESDPEVLRMQHELAAHDGDPVEGCPLCDDAIADEHADGTPDELAARRGAAGDEVSE